MNALAWEEIRERRATLCAVLLSILLHLLCIAAIAAVLSFEAPMRTLPEEDVSVEITFVDPPPTARTTPYLATTEAQRADTPPERPAFESDKDTRAAAELPATGDLPLPSQEGEEIPAAQFEDREYTAGPEPRPAAPPAAADSRPLAPPADQTAPVPMPTAPASEIALLQPVRPPQPRPEESRPEPAAARAIPQPRVPPAFQPQTRVTRLKGGITNRGRAAADAAATPLGAYKKQISDAIGSRWYYYVNEAVALLVPGTVEIRFVVNPDGSVTRVQVLRNSSNESFASTSVRAVADAEIPPIPEELRPMLQNSRIEVDFTFTILSR